MGFTSASVLALTRSKDGVILGHNEAHIRGMASNHADPEHWMRRHGTSMNDYRNDVNELLKPEPELSPRRNAWTEKSQNE